VLDEATGRSRNMTTDGASPNPGSPKRSGRHRRDSSPPSAEPQVPAFTDAPSDDRQPAQKRPDRDAPVSPETGDELKIRPGRPGGLGQEGLSRNEIFQQTGIAALISLAISTAPTVIMPAIPVGEPQLFVADRSPSALRDSVAPGKAAAAGHGPLAALRARLYTDHMVRNTLYLILSSGLQAAMGFAFWILTARLFSTTDVGIASSLISATVLISFAALFGLNSAFVRYLPTTRHRNELVTAGLLLVAGGGAVLGLVYVLLTPIVAPRLAFVAHSPILAAGFVLLTAASTVNLLTDSIFIASRKSGFAAVTDGGVGGIAKIGMVLAFAGTGAYGVYSASVGGFAAAALASLVLMIISLRWRPSLRNPLRALKPVLRFSAASYAGNIFSLLPTLVVPLIVLDRLGASAAAYYFVAFQVATLLYSAAYAVAQSSLAEGSHRGVDRRAVVRRSRRVMLAMCVPACAVLTGTSHWILLAFGARYSEHATLPLIMLVLGAIPIALSSWLWTVMRLDGQLRAIVVSSAVDAVAVCALAWLLASHGLTALTIAWPAGGLLSVAVAALFRVDAARRRQAARSSRAVRSPKSPPGRVPGTRS
jgi:O-antigen/teichoic acid export membrane protein